MASKHDFHQQRKKAKLVPTSTTDRTLRMCSQCSTKSSTRRRRRHTRTRTRVQRRVTSIQNDAVHDAGTQQRHHPIPKWQKLQTREVSTQKSSSTPPEESENTYYGWTTMPSPNDEPPLNWRDTTIKVKYKSEAHRHHPSTDPSARSTILYKLFGQLLFRRLQTTVDAHQSVDPAGFRRG